MAWTTIDTSVSQAAANGIASLFNSGSVVLLTSGDAELAAVSFGATAWGSATDANPAVLTAETMTADSSVSDGTIAKCQFKDSAGTTTLLAGSANAVDGDLVLSSATIPSGATSVTFTALTLSLTLS
ncbi:MAG: hypothetical protein MUF57_01165 [Gammaproteobacteria bacterium]|jgi:hypothetical protein|nr:hypothetical protein [Gammaproteobacteria bacterium]